MGGSHDMSYEPASFASLPGCQGDDHAAAFAAYAASYAVLAPENRPAIAPAAWTGSARGYFEDLFTPYRVRASATGLLTGYYEPVLPASRTRSARYPVPLHGRPPDLVALMPDALRGADPGAFTHMKAGPDGLVPYPTRAEIEAGALDHLQLAIAWLADPVDRFVLQVQGSGTLAFEDGGRLGLSYDGKNGHPYTSVGRWLIEQGHVPADGMTLAVLVAWLRDDPVRGTHAMQQNASYVFFKARDGHAPCPVGALDIPLHPLRSLAVDASIHALGTPIHVVAETLDHVSGGAPFQRLMIAHDVGSAITGPERGDLYFGSGEAAGALAGRTKHRCQFHVLIPRGARPPVSSR